MAQGKSKGATPPRDRGSRQLSIKYTEYLSESGVNASIGSVGDSDDYPLAETINRRLREPIGHIPPAEHQNPPPPRPHDAIR